MISIVLQGPQFDYQSAMSVAHELDGQLEPKGDFYKIMAGKPVDRCDLHELRRHYAFDINALPDGFCPTAVQLLITDMDSSLIAIECIDEIADLGGLGVAFHAKPVVQQQADAVLNHCGLEGVLSLLDLPASRQSGSVSVQR